MGEEKKTVQEQAVKETAQGQPVKAVKQEKAKETKEPVYTAEELLSACDRVFRVPRECLKAALKREGKTELSVSEAKAALKKFMERKVR